MKAASPERTGKKSPWEGSGLNVRAQLIRAGPDPDVRALPISEFCRAYRVSPATVWRAIAAGRLKTVTISPKPHAKRLILLSSVEQGQ
jgi:hypothetical protein